MERPEAPRQPGSSSGTCFIEGTQTLRDADYYYSDDGSELRSRLVQVDNLGVRMMVSRRVRVFVERNFSEPEAKKLLDILEGLDDAFMGGQDPERMAAAVVLIALEITGVDGLSSALRYDFRDILMDAGLANRNWPEVLEARFGEA